MVIGTRYDPATPYSFTRPFADLFPDGRMVTVEGYGYTILGKSTCADEAVARYLVRVRTEHPALRGGAGRRSADCAASADDVSDARVLTEQDAAAADQGFRRPGSRAGETCCGRDQLAPRA